MRFSSLIKALQAGESGLRWSQPGQDPDLSGAAALDQAVGDQLSFLEAGNVLSASLSDSAVGALLLPDQQDLIDLASQRGIAFAVVSDPRLAFAEALDCLHPRQRPCVHRCRQSRRCRLHRSSRCRDLRRRGDR
jgi:UDP-3-O-[3-hydroxymyristoyl] glucosamine N-acyltransferase